MTSGPGHLYLATDGPLVARHCDEQPDIERAYYLKLSREGITDVAFTMLELYNIGSALHMFVLEAQVEYHRRKGEV